MKTKLLYFFILFVRLIMHTNNTSIKGLSVRLLVITSLGIFAPDGYAHNLPASLLNGSSVTTSSSLRHASVGGVTLTTSNPNLVGFGANRSLLTLISPVDVSATEGLPQSSYNTLKEAFDAINSGTFGGDISITLNSNITETATAELFSSGIGSALYSSVEIYPTTSGITITGNLAVPLINLNGADNVTLDGRVNKIGSTNSLTIANTNIAGAVLQFINDATSNNIQYCNIQGVTTSAISGLIVFSTGSVIGNDNNTIGYCNIKDGATTPSNAIYSAGTSSVADNSNNTISNNNIYNYFSATTSSNGIYIVSNSSGWNISNNKFYQTSTRNTTTAGLTHRAINIISALGDSFIVNNNIIGFTDALGNGNTVYTGQSTLFRAIEMTVGTIIPSNVQGNTISNINFSTTNGLATSQGIFSGISILAGNVNVGSTIGNTIGNASGNGAIQITSTTSLGLITGIYYTTTYSGEIKNNLISSISTGGANTIGYTFNGIYTTGTGGNFAIANNTIGSLTTSNSITIGTNTTTTPICTFRGIYNLATGVISVSNNTIQNCTVYGTGASVFSGIINSAGTGSLDINGNKVISGTNTGTGIFVPITNSAAVAILNLNNNIIRSHSKTAISGTFTALSNTGAILSSININNNQLGNSDGGLITYSATNSAAFLGISNTGGAASCELSMQNNDIRGINYSGAAGTNAHTYIINSAATLKQNISSNTFTELNVNTNGAIIFISNSVAMPANGVQNINNNEILTSFVRNAASVSGAITLFTSTTATNNNNVTVTNNNNNFSNITISGAATISGWVNSDTGTGTYSKTIDGNIFNNWTGGTGAITALTVNINSTTNAVKNNIISNINSSGNLTGITTGAGYDNIFSNTITVLNSTGGVAATIVSGINVTAGTTKNIYGNTISKLTGNTLTTGSVRGILISGGILVNFYQNKVFTITANANTTGTISAIWATGGTTLNIDRNKIYDISSTSTTMTTGAVYGIQVSGAVASLVSNISNNVIGDLRAPASSLANLVIGIGAISTGATSNINVYYNSIYLNTTSTGTNFGSSGVFHTISTTATTATLDMRNNIIVNLSTPKGTGQTVAFRRSAGAASNLNNYASTSNNNLLYAGTPGTTRLLYADGTSTAQTIALYKAGVFTAGTIAPRDQASVTENPTFLSVDPLSLNFLHINPSISTQIESGAVNIPSFTIDYDNETRQGNSGYTGTSTTAPDIGADEGDFTPLDTTPPSITYTALINNSCITNKVFTAIITDGSGVNITLGTKPRIYFKKSTNNNSLPATNDNSTNGWKYVEASNAENPFSFTINYSLVFGGVTTGDIIQYFIVAQDVIEPTPYVGINKGTFAITPSSVNLTSAAFPIGGTINSFTLLAGLNGTVTVGSGGTYPTLTGTGGLFADINTKGMSADLTANIISDITEPGTISLNQIIYGCDAYNTLTISPVGGVQRTLSGTINGGALINLNGADYVIFDGLNTGGNSLVISNNSTSSLANTSTIRFINDATNNIIRNCTIEGSSNLIGSGTILFSTGTSSGNDGNSITNNIIKPSGSNLPVNAIYSAGSSLTIDNSDNTISNNLIYDYYSPTLASNGIFITLNNSAWNITGNKLYQTSTRTATIGNIHRGINIISASGVGYYVSNNTIGYSNSSSTGTTIYGGAVSNRFFGIEMTVGSALVSVVDGNKIAGINLSNTVGTAITAAPGVFAGISILGGRVDIGNTLGNTIGETTGTGSINITATVSLHYIAGIYAASTNLVNIKNNTIASINAGGTSGIGYTFHGINTVGGGQFDVSSNTIGSSTTPNSIAIGISGVTTSGVCTLNGITNTSTGGITINGNIVQNSTAYGTAASIFNGTLNSGAANLVTITSNTIATATNTGTGALTGISNTAAATRIDITNNTIRNLFKNVASGAVTGISNTGGVLSEININANELGNDTNEFITYSSLANSGTLTGISNTAGTSNCTLSISNNKIKGIVYNIAGTNAHTYIFNSAATLSQNINGNEFIGLDVNSTGAIIFISNSMVMPPNGIQNVNSNKIVTSYTRTAASGAITLFTSTTATNNSNVVVNNNNNDFSNINISGTASITGWINTDAGAGLVTKTIDGNTFSNWIGGTGVITALTVNINSTTNAVKNNVISNINSSGNITGITTGAGYDNIFSNTIHSLVSTGATSSIVNGIAITSGTVKNVYLNTIYNLQANNITTGSVSGISISGGANNNVYSNKIYTISTSNSGLSSGSVNGILISGAVADQITTLYNNRIGNLQASAANVTDNVRGISVSNTGLRSANNVYYNTIYLDATSSGTNFGSTGIFHTASTTSTTSKLNLTNNIIANLSTAKGTGYVVAYRRSSGTVGMLNNYNSTSNNNLFYAGIPSASNLIYADGTISIQTITGYKSGNITAGIISPRDQLSITENPVFISTAGSNTDFLKIVSNIITFIESGGVNISGITTDFQGDIRAGNPGYPSQLNGFGTAPDIGADEFDGKLPSVIVTDSDTNSNGSYSNLGNAFTAINAYDQSSKNILISIIGSTTESATARLNAGNWTSIKIFPTKTGISITGNIANAPMIELNGADKITLDGRVNQTGATKSLTLINTSTSSTAFTSTFRFVNSAENNILKYCTILGSGTSTNDGVITFGSSAAGSGNDTNVIEYCNISNANSNRAVNSIFSLGSLGSDNSQNIIRYNNIYDFLNPAVSSNGIQLNAYTSDFTISDNSFYETTNFIPTGSALLYNAIRIDNTNGNNFTISNNFIGGSSATCGGNAWTTNALTNHSFRSIYLNVGNTTASSIQNNVIKNWNYTTASTNPWRAIEINNGAVNIGTITGNIIGANTGTGSIVLTSSVNANSSAIYFASPNVVTISKNTIGSINILSATSNTVHSFTGIYKTAGIIGVIGSISNNTIGSSITGQSIYCGSAATNASMGQDLIGIFSESVGTVSITNNFIINLKNEYNGIEISRTRGVYTTFGVSALVKNTIYNLSSASLNTSVDSVIGIEMDADGGSYTVTDTQIYNLSNTNPTFSGGITGIQAKGLDNNNLVNRNFIHHLSVNASSTNANIYGIRMVDGGTTFANNIITLGGNTATTIYGLYGVGTIGDNTLVYFNTIYIGGNLAAGITNKSYALYGADDTVNRNNRNNIYANFRSTVGGASLHYAIYLNYFGNNKLTLNFNDYYVGGVGGVTGYHDGANVTTVPIVSGEDDKSLNIDPLIVNQGGSTAVDYKVRESLPGKDGTGYIVDYGQNARGVPPSMGAWELNANRWFGTVSTDFNDTANWSAGIVPLEEADVVFALDPLNHCVLDMNRTVGSIVNTQSTYNFVTNGKELTLTKGLFLSGGAKIDATSANSKLIFQGDESQIIPNAVFLNNTIPSLTIDNIFGVTNEGDFTITNTLNLLRENPSETKGGLDTGINVITLGEDAVTIGNGDVTGIVRRTSFIYEKTYTYGNKNASVYFINNGNPLPSSISVKITIGTAPSWRPNSIKRTYEFAQTGANPFLPTAATISGAYLDSELNGNDEALLVFQSYRTPPGLFYEHGRANDNPAENWLNLTNINMAFFPDTLGSLQLSLGLTELETLTWNGSVSTSWTTVNNWTPNGAPSDFVNVIIPNASSTTNDPILPTQTHIKTLKLEAGSIINTNSGLNSLMSITGGENAWVNEGGVFNPSTTTVNFENANATLSGDTSFNNVTIEASADLLMQDGSAMRISGVMNNVGVWKPSLGVFTTVEYNGGNQNVVVPNPDTNRYSTLILSGTGTKIMPTPIMSILGDLVISGTANVTAKNGIVINGNLNIAQNATFITGPYEFYIGGNLTHDGVFTTTGSILTFNGLNPQTISGNASNTLFNNITNLNTTGISCDKDITINGVLSLQSDNPTNLKGSIDMMNQHILFMDELASTIGSGEVSGIVKRVHTFISNQPYTFGSRNTTMSFGTSGTKPSEVSIKTTLGNAPSWKPSAIKRIYEFVQTGGVNILANVSLNYLDSELNANQEDYLVFNRAFGLPTPLISEPGFSDRSTDNNWVSVSGANAAQWPTSFGIMEITLAKTEFPNLTWNGSLNTNWFTPQNWTPSGFPNLFSNVIIPDAATTPNDPLLPSLAEVHHLEMHTGSILNSSATAVFNIYGENITAWMNLGGTFNPNTSTINFLGQNQDISGTTNFYNLSVKPNTQLTPKPSSIVRIAGTLLNEGIFDAAQNINTVEFNGVDQTVDIPNGTHPGFHHLTLSGSGIKTMPSSNFQLYGNFSVEGTASATSNAEMGINGNLTIANGAAWSTGAFEHIIGGDITVNGNFETPLNSSIQLAGNSIQNISGTAPINFENLTLFNLAHVNLNTNISIDGLFTLSEGQLIINNNTLSVSGTLNALNGKVNASTLSSLNISGTGDYTFSANLFTTHPSIENLTINRNGIIHTTNQNLTVNNALNLTLGTLDIDNNVFTMAGNTINRVERTH